MTKKTILLNIAVFSVYVIFGKFGLKFASVNPSATALWAPTGITLAAMLIFGYRVVPGILFGAFAVNLTTQGTFLTSIFIALGNTLEGVFGAYLVNKFAGGKYFAESPRTVVLFAICAPIISTMVSATIGIGTLFFAGLAHFKDLFSIWITWWLGDAGGDFVIAPVIVIWLMNGFKKYTNRFRFDAILFYLLIFVMSELIFSGELPYQYFFFPVIVGGAFLLGQKEEALGTVILSIVAIWNTLNNRGPYAMNHINLNQAMLLLQAFLGVCSITGLGLTAALIERKKIRGELASSEIRFRSLIEKSFDAVVLIDATSKILYASPSVETLLGYKSNELIGVNGFNLIAPQDKRRVMRTLAKLVLKPGGVTTAEYQTIRKDKKIIWVEATGTNLLFEPSVKAIVVNFHDVTEKKISNERIVKEKIQDEAMLGSIGEGIIATDEKGIITMVNDAACSMLGWSEKELVGKRMIPTFPLLDTAGDLIAPKNRPLTKVLAMGKSLVTSTTNYYTRKDGSTFPAKFTLTPIIIGKKVVGSIEVFFDITEEKAIDKAKTEFVSLASHQLRTPLTTINWYLEMMLKNRLENNKKDEYLNEVYMASKRMIELINALLNASRLELGTFIVEPKHVSMTEIAEQVLKDSHGELEKKNLIIKKLYQADLPQINADPKLLTILLQNIISNSVKYCRQNGEIDLELSFDKKMYLIKVTDNGIGIPVSQQKHIFTKLFRADNAQRVEPGGTGLGLYIAKMIVEGTGGKIEFKSKENNGTTFIITFPSRGMKEKKGEKELR